MDLMCSNLNAPRPIMNSLEITAIEKYLDKRQKIKAIIDLSKAWNKPEKAEKWRAKLNKF